MNPSALFIQRPVMTTLVTLSLVVFGVMAYRVLPVSDLPNVDFPTIQVSASLPGASPETIASSVATPLEREFSTIAGLDSMTSNNILGSSQITLQFDLNRNIDNAAQDVQAAIARAQSRLPRDMPSPPSYKKVNPADQPVLYIALTSDTLPMYTLNEYAETLMAQRISTVSGVAQVLVNGAQKFAVRVQVDPDMLAARGIGIDEVAEAISSSNVNLPLGSLDGASQNFTVETNGQLLNAADYRNVIIAYRDGKPVRVHEIGRVVDSVENDRIAAWRIDKRSIVLQIQKQPGVNSVEVVDRVKALLPQFRAQLPASVHFHTLYDRSESIRASVHDVEFTLWLTLALVVMVIFLFLRNLSATIIPAVAIPISLVGTFACMHLLGYSLDNLSLMALTLSVGFVVDDAIVVLENIVRHVERGETVFEAAMKGSKEIVFTVLSMTISLAAVFIPFVFMGGILGRLLTEFAVTIGLAIVVSGVVSLTLTPMMCSRMIRGHQHGNSHGRFYRMTEGALDAMQRFYRVTLDWSLRHRLTMTLLTLAVLVASVYFYMVIPKGFLPSEDTGRIFCQTEAAEGISFEAMIAKQQQMAAILRQDPRVESFYSAIGQRGGNASTLNTGTLFMRLIPRDKRPSVDELIQELRVKLSVVPGMRAYLQNLPPIRFGGQLTKSQYQYTLTGFDTGELYGAVPRLVEEMRKLEGFQDVTSDLQLSNPQVSVDIDRDKCSALGVTPEQIELALGSAYGAKQISTIYGSNNQYQVIIEVLPEFRRETSKVPLLHVRGKNGKLVRIDAVAHVSNSIGPLAVNHLGQLPSVTVSFNLAPGYSLGPAVEQIEKLSRTVLPTSVTGSFEGTAQAFQDSLKGLETLLILAVMVIYVVLGMLYESFVHPITILTSVPLAGFGALVTLWYFGFDLSLYAFVGVIMLVGLVKKNGIMMVDFAVEAQRERGLSPMDAIREACLVRFRPIMMTTIAALMGTLPIAMGYGAGAESRQPLGLAVVGGLLFSQSLTLYVTPVFYLYMERLRSLRRKASTSPPATGQRRKSADPSRAALIEPATST